MPFSLRDADELAARGPRVPAQLPQVELEILRGQARHRVRKVDVPVFLIGTADDCDLVLGDPQFPEVHSYLFLSADGIWVRHLGAEPAVTVEGRLVKSVQLCDGDHLRTGSYEFRVHFGSPLGHREGEGGASRFVLAARRHRSRSSAGLGVVQELLDEVRAELKGARGRRVEVA